jgi:acetyl-CoA decarbonylase/synthase complex subunit gamma
MALKGLDIFKLTPRTNCRDCGYSTCMAFSIKAAQGTISAEKCPHLSPETLKILGEATRPPMELITIGTGDCKHTLGGETVLYRHEKSYVSKTLYGIHTCPENIDARLDAIKNIDYERIGERMYIEVVNVEFSGNLGNYLVSVRKVLTENRVIILDVQDLGVVEAALEIARDSCPILNAANETNYRAMSELTVKYGAVLGVSGESLDSLHSTIGALEALGNKNLVIDLGSGSIKDVFARAVQIRRAALKDGDPIFVYPSLINLAKIAPDNHNMQTALAALFTVKYGSMVIMDTISYSQALPLFGLRQNIFSDPQKPMQVDPGIYPINGADENSPCAVSVDFALTYFMVSGELERSGVPVNLLICDAGGYSVLTAWAAGKFSADTIANFIKNNNIEDKIKNRNPIIPGKAAVFKGELEEKLPGWKIITAPNEALGLVKFMRELRL